MENDPDQTIITRVIGELGAAILERESGGFRLINPAPEWFDSCFGSAETILERSAFLDDFVGGRGTECWKSSSGEPVRSGMWEETSPNTGTAHYFEARALKCGANDVLIVILADEQHENEVSWVQHAHDEALQQRRLAREREKKEILLDCIVHDLSSPLSTILMNVQHVSRQMDSDELRKPLERAVTQAERQRNLIRSIADVFAADLSAFETIVRGGEEGVDIAEVAKEMIGAHEQPAHERHITVALETGDDKNWHVVGEREHLARVIDNLLSNAVRHSPSGSVVTLQLMREGKGKIRATVIDEGPGFAAEEAAAAAFRPFAQGEGNTGQRGLGLYFCRMAVELWGGTIGVKNRESGSGACIWFVLPRACQDKRGTEA